MERGLSLEAVCAHTICETAAMREPAANGAALLRQLLDERIHLLEL